MNSRPPNREAVCSVLLPVADTYAHSLQQGDTQLLMVVHARSVCRWVLLALVAQAHAAVTARDDDSKQQESVVRLGVKRASQNAEIERLVAKYKHSQRAVLNEIQTDLSVFISSFTDVFRTLAAGAASRVWWGDGRPSEPKPMTLSANHAPSLEAVETRIRSGEGSHTITVLVSGQERELIIDTGSGKTAFVCEGCNNCGHRHRHAPFHRSNNTKFLVCDPNNPGNPEMGGCMACEGSKCRYGQKYVEGDYWEAYKMSDEMSFPAHGARADAPSLTATIEFGCIYAQTGCFNQQSSDGIMGFSRHPDSVYEQFYRQQATKSRIFAQCLANDGGALTIGGVDMQLNKGPVAYTPLRNTGYQYWTVELESISIGETALEVESRMWNGDRGCVLDSGTTFVYLPTASKQAFTQAWRQATGGSDENLPVSDSYHRIADSSLHLLPEICFHFANNAKLCMQPESYMFKLATDEYAGTIFFGDEARSTIVGASALMHHNIIYDVDNNRVGIVEADCNAAVGTTEIAAERMIALELHPGGDTFRAAIDREYWAQLALASVAIVAVAGLVVTVWEEVRRTKETAKPASVEDHKMENTPKQQVASVSIPANSVLDTEAVDFAFVLMGDEE